MADDEVSQLLERLLNHFSQQKLAHVQLHLDGDGLISKYLCHFLKNLQLDLYFAQEQGHQCEICFALAVAVYLVDTGLLLKFFHHCTGIHLGHHYPVDLPERLEVPVSNRLFNQKDDQLFELRVLSVYFSQDVDDLDRLAGFTSLHFSTQGLHAPEADRRQPSQKLHFLLGSNWRLPLCCFLEGFSGSQEQFFFYFPFRLPVLKLRPPRKRSPCVVVQ